VVWPTSQETNHVLKWQNPARIHQNASKTMSSLANRDGTTLVVSGGDDGALAFLLADPAVPSSSSSQEGCASPLVLVNRAHGSAITACTIIAVRSHIYVLTSGNDEWIRLWEVIIDASQEHRTRVNTGNVLHVKRLQKVKTSIADVSSMAVLDVDVVATAKIIVCGVGMEVIRLDP
jgi:WD40 repeat protein